MAALFITRTTPSLFTSSMPVCMCCTICSLSRCRLYRSLARLRANSSARPRRWAIGCTIRETPNISRPSIPAGNRELVSSTRCSISHAVSSKMASTLMAATSVARVRLVISTALAATVTTSNTGKPLIMPPLLSANSVITTMSTRKTSSIRCWLSLRRVEREPTSGMLVARYASATVV